MHRLTAKDAALLAKLALDGPQTRNSLSDLLWPDSKGNKGYDNLRSRAYRLHQAAGTAVVVIDGHIALGSAVQVDVLRLDQLGTAELIGLGQPLAGVDLGDHDELDRWLGDARRRMAEACANALGSRASALEAAGNMPAALAAARRAVELMQFSEENWYRQMRLEYLGGDRVAAAETYWRFNALLRKEHGTPPGPALRQLLQTVEAAEQPAASRHRPLPPCLIRPPVFVGRDEPWRTMALAWQKADSFLLVGAAGLGKSRLLEEFCRGLQGIVLMQALAGDASVPYALLGRVLLEMERRYSPTVSNADRAELARVNPSFGQPPDAPAQDVLIEHALERYFAAALATGLQALVLDDLHAADAASLKSLQRVTGLPSVHALKLGMACRPELPAEVASVLHGWCIASRRPVRIELQPLTQAELGEFLASLMLPSLLDGKATERLFAHAAGNPLFTLCTLQAAIVAGRDLSEGKLPSPESVQALLDARIETLPGFALQLLHVAAVAGADLTTEIAAQLIGCTVLELARPWAALETADILRGERFSHSLVHEAALRLVPEGVRQGLHRGLAPLLAQSPTGHPARVAWHWEQGKRPLEAGRFWQLAARHAGGAALITEQNELYLRAANCFERGSDATSRFEALMAHVAGLQMRPGGAAVLEKLPELEQLADTDWRRLRCRLARAEALFGIERVQESEAEARRAVVEAHAYAELVADAEALHAQALVRCGQLATAQAAIERAQAAAVARDDRWQLLRVLQAASFVSFASGQVDQALNKQVEAVSLAERIGHRYEAAAGAGHVAALHAVIGDVARQHEHAKVAQLRLAEVGIDEDATYGSVNDRVLGTAAATLGQLDEALASLERAVQSAGRQAAPGALTKARLSLASLRLTLGDAQGARELVVQCEPDGEPGRLAQALWVHARADQADGLSGKRHWAAIGELARKNPDLPLVHSFWFEWSFQGDAQTVIDKLHEVQRLCRQAGMAGVERAFKWREVARWLDLSGSAAAKSAVALAEQLEPYVKQGCSSRCHPPEVWWTLSQAYARSGQVERATACHEAARQWLLNAALTLPLERRSRFAEGNPLHRQLFKGSRHHGTGAA